MSTYSALTQERLAWQPKVPGLVADLEQMRYAQFAHASKAASRTKR
jgi:hypothetical protein